MNANADAAVDASLSTASSPVGALAESEAAKVTAPSKAEMMRGIAPQDTSAVPPASLDTLHRDSRPRATSVTDFTEGWFRTTEHKASTGER